MKKLRKILFAVVGSASVILLASANITKVYAASPGAVGSWTSSGNTLPVAEEYSASVTYGGYVYVVGGVPNGGYSNAVYSAQLNSNGTVGSWTTQTNHLPIQVLSPVAVTYDGYIYVTGGLLGAGYNKNVYVAQLSNGTVGTWSTAVNTLPIEVYFSTAQVYDGYLYIVGGQYSGGVSSDVFTAPLSSSGGIGSWTTITSSLPQSVERMTSVINNGYLYILGGDNGGQLNTIYYSALGANGALGGWTTSTVTMPDYLSATVSASYDGYIYVFGGADNSGGSSSVYSAPFNANGTIGSWTTSGNSLPQTIDNATSVNVNGYVYVIGGGSNALLSTVYYAQLTGKPAPGISSQTTSLAINGSVTVNVLSGIAGDPDSSSLSIISGPSHGSAYDPPGTITYTPTAGYSGSDSLVYQVCSLDDEALCSQATLTFDILAASTVKAPDTGFGQPDKSNDWLLLGVFGSCSVILLGFMFLTREFYKPKKN